MKNRIGVSLIPWSLVPDSKSTLFFNMVMFATVDTKQFGKLFCFTSFLFMCGCCVVEFDGIQKFGTKILEFGRNHSLDVESLCPRENDAVCSFCVSGVTIKDGTVSHWSC